MEHAALANEAQALAPRVLAALHAYGYPGAQFVLLIVHNPFTGQMSRRQVAAWEVGRSATVGDGLAGQAICWLMADGEFAVSIGDSALERRAAEQLPGLPAVVSCLRALASDHSPP